MKRTVYECRACKSPCALIVVGDNKICYPCVCPVTTFEFPIPCDWKKVSELEIPEDKEEDRKENKP